MNIESFKKIYKNIIVRSLFSLLFLGVFLGFLSSLLSKLIGPGLNHYLSLFSGKNTLLAVCYFIYNIIQTIIVPLPSLPIDVAMFVILGPWYVLFLNFFGSMVGYSISYFLARKFGRRLLAHLLPQKTYLQINELAEKMSWKHFLGISAIPFNQPDLMPYVAGLTKLGYLNTIGVLALTVGYRLAFTVLVLFGFWRR